MCVYTMEFFNDLISKVLFSLSIRKETIVEDER